MSLRTDEETIQAILDGKLDARRFQAFEDRLRREPELRALYRSYSRIGGLLEEKFSQSEPNTAPLPRATRRSRIAWIGVAAAAAAVAITLPALSPEPVTGPLVEFGPESHGQLVHELAERNLSRLLPGSRIELSHGSASIQFESGGEAYFEGPGRLEYLGPDRFRLVEGRAWFDSGSRSVACRTQHLEAESQGAEFGMLVDHAGREELHVLKGEVTMTNGPASRQTVDAGTSALWSTEDVTLVKTSHSFATRFPSAVTVFEEDFSEPDLTPLAGKNPDHGVGSWKVEYGGPLIENGVLDTSGNVRHTAFAGISGPPLDELSHILLLTLETENPDTAGFHSAGWAGVSLFTGDEERIFVGDPNGPEEGWALHPAGYSARHACPLLEGKTTVTLRYDYRSGLAQLFEGTDTSGPALASEWIAPGLQFDRVRIANGSQADAAVDAGKPASAAGDGPDVNVRGDIAIRRIKLRVLSSESATVPGS
ncbi:anti-sigma factor family protein [Haloferula rosea]|uniref:FecR protein n=1 Tax=Haloferula rosea TaxID=490093 RepID=A0A934RCV7_9BACT|nr:hypothetical protein [Haloferula rosea]MBK1826706.1 hypothetical protein [Haloferula rosea]